MSVTKFEDLKNLKEIKEVLEIINEDKEVNEDTKIVTGTTEDMGTKLKSEFEDMVHKAMGDLLEKVDIEFNIFNMDLTLDTMNKANLDFEVNMKLPICEIFLVRLDSREYVDGSVVIMEKGNPVEGNENVFKVEIVIGKLDEKFWIKRQEEQKNKDKFMTEILAEVLVNIFDANKEKVIEALNNTKSDDVKCDCAICRLKTIINREFHILADSRVETKETIKAMIQENDR